MPSPAIDRSQPKYARLAEMLRGQIEGGSLKPGDRLPSFSEMRAQHGVTLTTVTRVHQVLESEGMIERQQGRGVFVSEKRPTTRCLGVLTGFTSDEKNMWRAPYWAHLMSGVQEAAHDAGYEVLLLNRNSAAVGFDKVDAVLTPGNHVDHLKGLPPSMPCVAMLSNLRGIPSVMADEFGGIALAVEHLVKLGHERIGFLVAENTASGQMRLAAYRNALYVAAIEREPVRVRNAFGQGDSTFRQAGLRAMRAWLRDGWEELRCTALLCHNDETAVGALEALHEAGIEAPRDLSVVGFDGTEISEFARPTLTTVRVPLQEIGAHAVQMLLEQLETGQRRAQSVVLPTQLKIGGSTGPL